MAKRKIKWSLRAIHNKIAIYEYWLERNKSPAYPEKLERLFDEAVLRAAVFPFSGIKTKNKNIRIQLVKNYKLVYHVTEIHIEVITIFDSRRDPKELKF